VKRALLVAAGLTGAFIALLIAIDRLSPAPEGPPSSSYATSPRGVAAYAALLERAGLTVRRVRTPIADRRPRDGETLVILDPQVMEPKELDAIRAWVQGGGRLVVGSSNPPAWLDQLLDEPPTWDAAEARAGTPLVPLAGVRRVEGLGGAALEDLGSLLPLLDPPLAASTRLGAGELVLLADTSPLSNRALSRADNAAFGLALAQGAPVAFLETVHGYGVSRGLGGLPASVRWTLLGLALTALAAVWTAGRRFGPPEDPDTEPPPPRVEYVDALAGALARTKPDKEKS
jgi:hypothetical protein